MLGVGDYVQTRRGTYQYRAILSGTRGTVASLEGDWATVELPQGGRFQSQIDNLTRLVRATDIKREEQLV